MNTRAKDRSRENSTFLFWKTSFHMIEKAVLLNGNPPSEALCAIWHIRCPNHPVSTNQIHNIKKRIFYRSRSVKKWLRPPFWVGGTRCYFRLRLVALPPGWGICKVISRWGREWPAPAAKLPDMMTVRELASHPTVSETSLTVFILYIK